MLAQLQFLPSSLVGVVVCSSYTIVCELQLKTVKTVVYTASFVAAKWKLLQLSYSYVTAKWKLLQLSENSVKQGQS